MDDWEILFLHLKRLLGDTMDNQTISWILFIVPWVTILLMNNDDKKRFVPAGLFSGITSGLIYQLGMIADLWYFKDVNFPVIMYGLFAVAAIWVLKFTFGRFWVYTITNAILDAGFAYVIFPWFGRKGLIGVGDWTSLFVYTINFIHAALIYGYQMWQDDIFKTNEKTKMALNVQPVPARRFDDKNEEGID
ncbi:hypothetical protein GTO91_08615 [Heliobacterium undosum]|uniref:Uncharacterized protein n=1 Tax=Heliomicrobium undosum TaxID=121734 RepID=A0A845L282_9FIRM|nr:hypothetical protein [Heliomicrobium undosum]MZP29766.1 hypothetical protein [Heliomicrobium undosum]